MDPNTHLASLFSQTMTTLSIFKPEGNKVEPKKTDGDFPPVNDYPLVHKAFEVGVWSNCEGGFVSHASMIPFSHGMFILNI